MSDTYLSISSNLTSVGAHVAKMEDGSRRVVLRGNAGFYPTMSVLMSPETAEALLESLRAALAELPPQMESAA